MDLTNITETIFKTTWKKVYPDDQIFVNYYWDEFNRCTEIGKLSYLKFHTKLEKALKKQFTKKV